MTWSPIASSTLRLSLNTFSSPPTSSAILPDFAPWGPPDTGASSMLMPCSAQRADSERTTVGELVVRSNHTPPRFIDAIRSAPTASASRGPGREVSTTSTALPSACTLSAQVAPAASCGLAASARTSKTTRSKPALRKLSAMDPPMVPSPMNPIFMNYSLVVQNSRVTAMSRITASGVCKCSVFAQPCRYAPSMRACATTDLPKRTRAVE